MEKPVLVLATAKPFHIADLVLEMPKFAQISEDFILLFIFFLITLLLESILKCELEESTALFRYQPLDKRWKQPVALIPGDIGLISAFCHQMLTSYFHLIDTFMFVLLLVVILCLLRTFLSCRISLLNQLATSWCSLDC